MYWGIFYLKPFEKNYSNCSVFVKDVTTLKVSQFSVLFRKQNFMYLHKFHLDVTKEVALSVI